MPEIQKIDDAYIDAVIKATEVYNPNLDVTQGARLRELIKLMRDQMEQQGDLSQYVLNGSDCAVMFQVGTIERHHFHFAFLNRNQALSLVAREFDFFGDRSDNFIRSISPGIDITTTLEAGHTHTITVNYNPYSTKFFIYNETVPAGHIATVLIQDNSSAVDRGFSHLIASALPSTFPFGVSYDGVFRSGGFPIDGLLITNKMAYDGNIMRQELTSSYEQTSMYIRVAIGDTYQEWKQVAMTDVPPATMAS